MQCFVSVVSFCFVVNSSFIFEMLKFRCSVFLFLYSLSGLIVTMCDPVLMSQIFVMVHNRLYAQSVQVVGFLFYMFFFFFCPGESCGKVVG